jgi:hypothetical protein
MILSQVSSVSTLTIRSSKIHSNIVLLSQFGFRNASLLRGFLIKIMYAFLALHKAQRAKT